MSRDCSVRQLRMTLLVLAFACAAIALANTQAQSQTATSSAVPHVVNFNGVLTNGAKPLAATVGVTFLLYKDQQGGAPLWLETQNVRPDRLGHYSATLGSNTALPSDIFSSGEARWLAVQPVGESEQPRVLLVAVPYALKAADAETIGGLPPSAFMLAAPSGSASTQTPAEASTSTTPAVPPVSGTGTANFVPLWLDSAGTLGNSVLFQSGTGTTAKTGVNTNTPAATLDVKGTETVRGIFSLPATGVATATAGKASQPASMVASVFNSGTSTAVNETFRWQAEPTGNNTATTSGSMNLLFGQGSSTPVETGFNIASNGLLSFAPGQTFPGTGVSNITEVAGGVGITGDGTSGKVTLALDTTVTDTRYAQLAAPNVFSGTQTINGGLIFPTTTNTGSGVITMGGHTFLHQFGNFGNIFLGQDSGNFTNTASGNVAVGENTLLAVTRGSNNEAVGEQALLALTSATANTAVGALALAATTTGGENVGIGTEAGQFNVTGTNNVFVGNGANAGTTNLTFATAIGSNSFVSASNSLALGGIGTAAVKVGIGTDKPAVLLDVVGATPATHSPVAQFGSTGLSDANSMRTYNGTGLTDVFIAGASNTFVTGSKTGDGGLRVNPGRSILFGDSGLARMTIDSSGNVKVTGNLSKGGGSFKIDHPLDPLNKFLYHSFVESPDMMNVYNGNVTTDRQGRAIVVLPEYFQALNRDFRYQLTVIGRFAQAIVARKIANNRFVIRTSKPSVEVSWQVTGIRQDPYANVHRIPVEEEKQGSERGSYLHPDAYAVNHE